MGTFIDLTGQRFGRLTVIRRVQNLRKGATRWECLCDCGGKCITYTSNLRRGNARSCGCLHIESAMNTGKNSATHGKTNTRLYRIWTNMKTRCYNKRNKNYEQWGKRGIYVCEEWRNNFESFYNWSISNGYGENLSIDRIDNNGPYCPENCRWSTPKEQANNTRRTRLITWNGETLSLHGWAEKLGLGIETLFYRLKKMTPEEAFTLPVQNTRKNLKQYQL